MIWLFIVKSASWNIFIFNSTLFNLFNHFSSQDSVIIGLASESIQNRGMGKLHIKNPIRKKFTFAILNHVQDWI